MIEILKFFEDSVKSSRITGIGQELVSRFGISLLSITSGYCIKKYDLARFVDQYLWYMPQHVATWQKTPKINILNGLDNYIL